VKFFGLLAALVVAMVAIYAEARNRHWEGGVVIGGHAHQKFCGRFADDPYGCRTVQDPDNHWVCKFRTKDNACIPCKSKELSAPGCRTASPTKKPTAKPNANTVPTLPPTKYPIAG
jgi:hypothetical protein